MCLQRHHAPQSVWCLCCVCGFNEQLKKFQLRQLCVISFNVERSNVSMRSKTSIMRRCTANDGSCQCVKIHLHSMHEDVLYIEQQTNERYASHSNCQMIHSHVWRTQNTCILFAIRCVSLQFFLQWGRCVQTSEAFSQYRRKYAARKNIVAYSSAANRHTHTHIA